MFMNWGKECMECGMFYVQWEAVNRKILPI